MKHYSRMQLRYLNAMGVPAWTRRNDSQADLNRDSAFLTSAGQLEASVISRPRQSHAILSVAPNSMTTSASTSTSDVKPAGIPGSSNITFEQWLVSCQLKTVGDAQPGRVSAGPERSELLVLIDHLEGELTASANRLLDAMLNAIELTRSNCRVGYLCNTSSVSEGQTGGSVSVGQLLSKSPPKIVLFFTSPKCLHEFCEPEKIQLSTPAISLQGIGCRISYHPEYLLSNQHLKRAVWEELKKVRAMLRGSPSSD